MLGPGCRAGFSVVTVSRGYSLIVRLLIAVASLVAEHGFSGVRLPGSRAQAQQSWHMVLVALRLMGSSWTRDQTCVSCIGWWILYQLSH